MKTTILAALAAAILAGCALPREAMMDWPGFIASVPGTLISDASFKTPTLKQSHHRNNTPGLELSKTSFDTWCEYHGGRSSNMPPWNSTNVAKSFYDGAAAWSNQEWALHGRRHDFTSLFCLDSDQQLMAVMLLRSDGGTRQAPYAPDEWPAPVIAFYTPYQATQFADYYNLQEKKRIEAARREAQQRADLQAAETRRLRSTPKIGNMTRDGLIIDLRPPLALIQYHPALQQSLGKPQQEWLPIQSLSAP
ncbi:hypothetical protein [Herbaspirillum huttiense]|jgi:hypothetical protein|uniref:DUF2931 family protein n=2 Tax=Herbaspirillum huttiense TaxID=863372 RepID=A0AAJ2LQD2_9BURK|nr:hypothetical protein [Herbaspirillum huttiense]MDR9834709.1 hypothetical protein [Herbaspirillum huttiense]UWE14604.1 hypothetical protein NY669_15965 [Herbaspirillum huttiense]